MRIRFSIPALVTETIKLASRFGEKKAETTNETELAEIHTRLKTVYMFLNQTIFALTTNGYESETPREEGKSVEGFGKGLLSPSDMALRLYVMAAQNADLNGMEEMAYEFFVQVSWNHSY